MDLVLSWISFWVGFFSINFFDTFWNRGGQVVGPEPEIYFCGQSLDQNLKKS
jgi:hypothetical protein